MSKANTTARQHYNLQDLLSRSKRMPSNCIEWQMSTNQYGYGRIQVGGKVQQVTRVVLKLVTNNDGNNLLALHSCDNPPCINPDHLRWGTQLDNMQDAVNRNRKPDSAGELNGRAILTEKDVFYLRSLPKPNVSEIAKHYGVSYNAIYRLLKGFSWKHLLKDNY